MQPEPLGLSSRWSWSIWKRGGLVLCTYSAGKGTSSFRISPTSVDFMRRNQYQNRGWEGGKFFVLIGNAETKAELEVECFL